MSLSVGYNGQGAGLNPMWSVGTVGRVLTGTVSFSGTYPDGGEGFDPAEYFPRGLLGIFFETKDGYMFEYDAENQKVKVLTGVGANQTASAGTPAGTVVSDGWGAGVSGEAGQAVTAAATPGGNKVYIKYTADGRPYLCSNLNTAQADVFITVDDGVVLRIVHDASAATGGAEVKFDENEDAVHLRLSATLPTGAGAFIATTDPNQMLYVAHAGQPAGESLHYDDAQDGNGLCANISDDSGWGLATMKYKFTGSALAAHSHGAGNDVGEVADNTVLDINDVRFIAWGY
jgi:hypothetical protein